eukprot:41802-Eustigmatos_ZCMA.PRE.1
MRILSIRTYKQGKVSVSSHSLDPHVNGMVHMTLGRLHKYHTTAATFGFAHHSSCSSYTPQGRSRRVERVRGG